MWFLELDWGENVTCMKTKWAESTASRRKHEMELDQRGREGNNGAVYKLSVFRFHAELFSCFSPQSSAPCRDLRLGRAVDWRNPLFVRSKSSEGEGPSPEQIAAGRGWRWVLGGGIVPCSGPPVKSSARKLCDPSLYRHAVRRGGWDSNTWRCELTERRSAAEGGDTGRHAPHTPPSLLSNKIYSIVWKQQPTQQLTDSSKFRAYDWFVLWFI